MANFEGLIRQALANHDASDADVRERIYNSSRNALRKMLERSGISGSEEASLRQRQLDQAIIRIEAEYAEPKAETSATEQVTNSGAGEGVRPASVEPAKAQPTQSTAEPVKRAEPPVKAAPIEPESSYTPAPAVTKTDRMEPVAPERDALSLKDKRADIEPIFDEPVPRSSAPPAQDRPTRGGPAFEDFGGSDADHDAGFEDDFANQPVPRYQRKNPILRRIWPLLLIVAVLLVGSWILYALFTDWQANAPERAQTEPLPPVGEAVQTDDGAILITLLEPTDLSGLITAGRGSAELINQQNRSMLRIQSIRQTSASDANADPILLELENGVLRQIIGKEVTVEFLAKSGMTGPTQFAVQCNIGGDNICGRKRFRIGLQPERIVFSMQIPSDLDMQQPAHLAISTDITNAADTSGEGNIVDVIYVRLRVAQSDQN